MLAVARLLILGGGCRGRQLATELLSAGHAVRIVTRSDAGRAAIEALGAECFIGDPNRLGTLRGVLDGVTVACWLLATAKGSSEQLRELHSSRLPAFLGMAIDSTVRGFIFEAPAEAAQLVGDIARRNAIPATALRTDPRAVDLWLQHVRATLAAFL
jgi:uncharacterized protein YbjT (DUF2867 family)